MQLRLLLVAQQLRVVEHADAGIVVAEFQGVSQQDEEQRVRPLPVLEAILHADGVEGQPRPLVQPLDVVAVVRGHDAQRICLGQRTHLHSWTGERI
ncbi:MAG TPA: hypothetical protein VGF24_27925, partial [Vicinamibacterales bacterium]